jgi:hypothetical protein
LYPVNSLANRQRLDIGEHMAKSPDAGSLPRDAHGYHHAVHRMTLEYLGQAAYVRGIAD